jgi:hypothetical protein
LIETLVNKFRQMAFRQIRQMALENTILDFGLAILDWGGTTLQV